MQQYKQPDDWADLLPFSFSNLLNILSEKDWKDKIWEEILECALQDDYNEKQAFEDFKKWVWLFWSMNEKKSEMMNPDANIIQKLRFMAKYKEVASSLEQRVKQRA